MRQRDALEEWLVGKQMTLLMQRADDFRILRRTPVAGYDISFLITAQVCVSHALLYFDVGLGK